MRIYLAGPDVFLPQADVIAAAKKDIFARHGMTGVFPLMIDGGILTRVVPEERRWSDLGAFEDCIAALAASRRD
jgi:nucleoside 2-deoxyribosyltransferase